MSPLQHGETVTVGPGRSSRGATWSQPAEAAPAVSTGLPAARRTYRILLLTQDLKLAGAQRQLVELARGLAAAAYDVRVGILEPGGPLTSDLTAGAIPLVAFPRRWRWDLWPVVQLANYLRHEGIDIIHSFLFLPSFYGRLAGRLARVSCISSLRGTGIEGWYRYRLDIATCSLCDALIANSAAGRADYVAHGGPPEKIVVIRNGLDSARLQPTAALPAERARWHVDRFEQLIGMVGTMENLRDHRLLVSAMRHVVRVKPRTGLLLVGDGTLRDEIGALVRRLELSDHVVFTGTVRRAEEVYPLLDVYVQASATEGISNSILESMFCALPVVATNVGGNPEVVLHGRTGYLVPRGDESAMAQALLALLSDPHLRHRMGHEGLQYARAAFGLERMVSDTQGVYEGLICGNRQPADYGSGSAEMRSGGGGTAPATTSSAPMSTPAPCGRV